MDHLPEPQCMNLLTAAIEFWNFLRPDFFLTDKANDELDGSYMHGAPIGPSRVNKEYGATAIASEDPEIEKKRLSFFRRQQRI